MREIDYRVEHLVQPAHGRDKIYDRFQDYAGFFFGEEQPLTIDIRETFQTTCQSVLDFLKRLTPGQNFIYQIALFDMEILNGGLAQFFGNHGKLAFELPKAFRGISLENVAREFDEIAELARENYELLRRHWSQDIPEGAEDGEDYYERYFKHYAEFKEAISPLAEPFQKRYFPFFEGKGQSSSYRDGPLQIEISTAVCDYIETHPREFFRRLHG